MVMNAHSTAVMTKLGRVVGNTMTNVRAANLKLIGRATYLVLTHVNDVAQRQSLASITYAEANAILFETINFLQTEGRGSESPVPLTIVRILESLKLQTPICFGQAESALTAAGNLEGYLFTK